MKSRLETTSFKLMLPKIKTEFARNSFMFMGAKVFNKLTLELRKIENCNEFEKQLKEHLKLSKTKDFS